MPLTRANVKEVARLVPGATCFHTLLHVYLPLNALPPPNIPHSIPLKAQ